MHLPTDLTTLSCSMTTFSLVIFIEIVNIAVKIQQKINYEAGKRDGCYHVPTRALPAARHN